MLYPTFQFQLINEIESKKANRKKKVDKIVPIRKAVVNIRFAMSGKMKKLDNKRLPLNDFLILFLSELTSLGFLLMFVPLKTIVYL